MGGSDTATGAERRAAARYKLIVSGLFVMPDGTEVRCVTEDASVGGFGIRSAKRPHLGAVIEIEFHFLGVVRAEVVRHTERGFGVRVLRTAMGARSFGKMMVWLVTAHNGGVREARAHARYVPRERDVVVSLPDGRNVQADILDVSRSGVAISTDVRPPLGTLLHVGKTRARVVRHLEDGIGLAFQVALPESRDLGGSPGL